MVASSFPEKVKLALSQAFRSIEASSEDYAVLDSNVVVGNWRCLELTKKLSVGAVCNCALVVETPSQPENEDFPFVRLSMPDAPHPNLDVTPILKKGAEFVHEHVTQGRRVLVHCFGNVVLVFLFLLFFIIKV